MRKFKFLFTAPLGRATLGIVGAILLVAMATPAQAWGMARPLLQHLSPARSSQPMSRSLPRQQGTLIEFDAPGASDAYSPVCNENFLFSIQCGTTPLDNNDRGDVVGTYTDAGLVQHGFLRYPNGDIISFEAPGAGNGPGQGTVAYDINDGGVIAGAFADANNVYHGFLRYPDGSFVTIDAPAAGTGAQQGTFAFDVNPAGTTTGTYVDAANVNHGFVRTAANQYTSFDPPGSVFTYPCEESCLSPDGTVTGAFVDAAGTVHGFVRTRDGVITVFDAPDSIATIPVGVNARGEIAGNTVDASGGGYGFVRYKDGSIVTFNDPDAGPIGTGALGINNAGATTGGYFDAQAGTVHGFERDAQGHFVNFSAPDGSAPPFPGNGPAGTRPTTINNSGEVTGWYTQDNGAVHGFVWQP
jgi:hypothetical protein